MAVMNLHHLTGLSPTSRTCDMVPFLLTGTWLASPVYGGV